MKRMLEKELDGLDYEIIYSKWSPGLLKASGDFVCLLDKDSAIAPGTIRDNLATFTDNPSYRKLAMVTGYCDFDDQEEQVMLTYDRLGLLVRRDFSCMATQAVRIGMVPGAVIRRSSLLKSNANYNKNRFTLSADISIDFWTRGLRILLNPDSLYYFPVNTSSSPGRKQRWRIPDYVMHDWDREMIS